jgi:DNA-binding NarL/FixJ family response regulator
MKKINIILADDHRIFRDGIASLLADTDFAEVVGEASNGQELLSLLTEMKPDIAIVDVTMPGMNGIEVTERIVCQHPEVKVLILSMHNSEEFVMNALKAGAMGYLPKDTSREELLDAIRTIADGNEYFGKGIGDQFLKSWLRRSKSEQAVAENNLLTQREIEVLKYAAAGLPNKEIADKLFISIRTVDCHKNHIMQKLKLKNTAELVLFAIRNKLIEP